MSKERFAARDEDLKFYDINGVEMTLAEVKAAQAAAKAVRQDIEDQQADDQRERAE